MNMLFAGEAGLGAAADHPGDPEEHHGVEHAARARAEGLRPPQEGQRAQGGCTRTRSDKEIEDWPSSVENIL